MQAAEKVSDARATIAVRKGRKPIGKTPMTFRQQIRMDEQMYDEVAELADEQERSLAMMLRLLVKIGLESVGNKKARA